MNKTISEKIILEQAVAAAQKSTGIRITATRGENPSGGSWLKVKPPPNNSHNEEFIFLAEIKKTLTQTALADILIQARRSGTNKPLLVTEYVAPAEADRLRELNISFFDAAGNAYLNEPGLYVFVKTAKLPTAEDHPTRKNKASLKDAKQLDLRPSELKIVFALLNEPKLEAADYRTIADAAGVALGSVGWLMNRLRENNFLAEDLKNRRNLLNKPELLRIWVEGYIERLRPKILLARFAASATGKWWETIDLESEKAVWGGEIGGRLLTGYLKPQTVTIYADSILPRLQAKYGLRRTNGAAEVEILQRFWTSAPSNKNTAAAAAAPPLVIYADLLATGDERNLEAAQQIYDRYLARLVGETA